ncbi:bifunctional hydroxymethylpyrimidine kinase/phosphomethylpyrimidine kinase [Candidatus Solincola sp.]
MAGRGGMGEGRGSIRPVALTIAGSDSGGGAGIQADLKTFFALGVHGTCALTSVTSQNTSGVISRFDLPAEVVVSQVEAVASDLEPAAVKTGMLATAEVVRAVAGLAESLGWEKLVVDPVVISSSGHPLLEDSGIGVLLEKLLPRSLVFTPNLAEASLLTGIDVVGPGEMRKAARILHSRGARTVVVKGGHLGGNEALDVFFNGKDYHELRTTRVNTADDHGTGCVFSAAVAAYLALGREPLEAVRGAKDFVTRALARSLRLGRGRGPVNPACAADTANGAWVKDRERKEGR